MGRAVSFFNAIRNNWKKSVFGACAVGYASSYAKHEYNIQQTMREYCEEAVKYGDAPAGKSKLRRITVILNPAANNKKAKKMFEKYCAPLLYLSGVFVSIMETEKEGHARELVHRLDPHTDAIVIAGGDGTFSESITGLMRAKGELCRIPIGVLPLGQRNSLATTLFGSDDSDDVARMAMATMAVIKGNTKSIDAFRIEVLNETKSEDKEETPRPVYGVGSVEWGLRREFRRRADNLWWLGPLRNWASLVFSTPLYHTEGNLGLIEAQVKYSPPCSGCRNCYRHRADLAPPQPPDQGSATGIRWWNIISLENRRLQQPITNVPVTDYNSIENERCTLIEEKKINTSDLCLSTDKSGGADGDVPKILMKIGPPVKYQGQLLSEGIKILNDSSATDDVEAKQIEIRPMPNVSKPVINGEGDCLAIDNEDYEVKPIKVTVLPNSVKVFY